MTGYLLDTNVVSELRKGERCDPRVRSWFELIEPERLWLSVLVVGEIRRGIEQVRSRDPRQAASLDAWLAALLAAHGERVLPVSLEVAQAWGRLAGRRSLPVVDALLAATAHAHQLVFATRNGKDVAGTEVPCVNPFEP